MVKYNSNILILTAVVGLAVIVSGCVNSSEPTQKSAVPTVNSPSPIQTPILNERSSMSFYEFDEAMLSNDLTSLQKQNLYVNKIFMWNGKVTDVTQDTIKIEIEYCLTLPSYNTNYKYKIQQSCGQYGDSGKRDFYINLRVDDDQKPKLNSLSKGSIITFEGTITDNPLLWNGLSLNMHSGRIIG